MIRLLGCLLSLLALAAQPAFAQTNPTISQLPTTTLGGAEMVPLAVTSGMTTVTRKTTIGDIKVFSNADRQALSANLTTISGLTLGAAGTDLLTAADAAAIRTKAGLGSLSVQGAGAVAITGGTIAGATISTSTFSGSISSLSSALSIANGGTGCTTLSCLVALLGSNHPYATGRWFLADGQNNQGAVGVAPGANSMRLAQIRIRQPGLTVAALAVRISTQAASSNFQLMIYGSSATTGFPTGTALYCSGSITGAAAGAIETPTISITLAPGIYWMGINQDNATLVYSATTANAFDATRFTGRSTSAAALGSTIYMTGYSKSQTFGTCPTLTGDDTVDGLASVTSLSVPIFTFKAQ